MTDEEAEEKLRRVLYVPEDADVPSFDGLPPLARACVRRGVYEWDCRVQFLIDGIGQETAAAFQELPSGAAEKGFRALVRHFAGDLTYICAMGAFVGSVLEEQPKEAQEFLSELTGQPPDEQGSEAFSAMWELVDRWVDEGTRLFDDSRTDDRWHQLDLPDVYFREVRRHLKNTLGRRARKDSPERELLAFLGTDETLDQEAPAEEMTQEAVLLERERVQEIIKRHARPRDPELVDEERRVLELIAEGFEDRQACREAGVSTRVIERIRDRERAKRGSG
jgi:hypothetical protein